MKLTEICIDRPVFACVLSLILILCGAMSYSRLSLRYDPNVFKPSLMIITNYDGASAQQVEQSITDRLEKNLAGTPNLSDMRSRSEAGRSRIMLHFKSISKEDFLSAQSQVLQEVASTRLPTDVDSPLIMARSDQGGFQMFLGVGNANMSRTQLVNYVNNIMLPRLQKVPGVAEVQFEGFTNAVRIHLDPRKMAVLGLTVPEVMDALDANQVSFAAGNVITPSQNLTVNANFLVPSVQAFENLVISSSDGGKHLIHLKDFATVSAGSKSPSGWFVELDHKPAVGLQISAMDSTNPIDLGVRLHQTLNQLKPGYPPGMIVKTLFDISQPLQQAVHEVYVTIFEAICLVVIITLLFLGSWRATLIPIVTIPICLLFAFAIMLLFGFSINVLTLLALVLGVGLVVDDAIVVLENNYRHLEAGESPKQAARISSREISFAVIGMTISLVAVYAPAGLMEQNTVGVYFKQFAFTLAGAVLVSGFVALTLSPMMCSRVLKSSHTSRYGRWLDRVFGGLRRGYQALLGFVLNHRWWVVVLFVLCLVFGVWVFKQIPSTLLPKSEIDVLRMFVQGPQSANADYIKKKIDPVLHKITANPNVANYVTFAGGEGNGSNWAFSLIQLTPSTSRSTSNDQLLKQFQGLLAKTPSLQGGLGIIDLNSDNGGSNSQTDMEFYITAQASYKSMLQAVNRMKAALQKYPGVSGVQTNLKFNDQQFNLEVNRTLAATLGVPMSQISQTLAVMLGGQQLNQDYIYGGISYPVVVQLPKKDLGSFTILKQIYVTANDGKTYPLSEFVTAKPIISLPTRFHMNQMRAAQMGLNIQPGYTLGQVMSHIDELAKTTLPAGMQLSYTGSALKLIKNTRNMVMMFVLGLLFIYLILAALFESFIDPLIILLTVPLCMIGAIVVLWLTGGSINLFTGIGLVTLIGLVSKHGVLITRFANELIEQGTAFKDAIIQAASIRLRPILMTTATMVLGALPLVFAGGIGHEERQQIGIVIVAGLLVGTVFSLLIVPVAYSILSRRKK